MNLRWLWFDFVDPRFELTREQKHEVAAHARWLSFINRPIFTAGQNTPSPLPRLGFLRMGMGCASGSVVLVVVLLMYGVLTAFTAGSPLQAALALIGVALLYLGFAYINYQWSQPWYRLALYELGHPICAGCGYPLIGIEDSQRCPECGWRKTYRTDPPKVAWSESDREALAEEGYAACGECGGLLSRDEATCARCGEPRGD